MSTRIGSPVSRCLPGIARPFLPSLLRYDRYRRRQRLFVEMEQMASRPFGSVLVELERIPEKSSSSSSSTAAAGAGAHHQQQGPSTSRQAAQPSQQPQQSESGIMLTSSASANANLDGSQQQQMVVRKRKRRYRPSPIALEPCEGNRAAVLSLIVRLPTGGKPYAPPGYTGIAVASSLVTLGNPRKASTDVAGGKDAADVKGRKGRKAHAAQPADI